MTPPPLPAFLTPVQRMRILAVIGGRCERCRKTINPRYLQVHPLTGSDPNPEKQILILCPRCGRYVGSHLVTPALRRRWVDRRPFWQRVLIRNIFGYRSAPYVPPEGPSLEELYQTACSGWCLNGSG